jgi:hypothetical protein
VFLRAARGEMVDAPLAEDGARAMPALQQLATLLHDVEKKGSWQALDAGRPQVLVSVLVPPLVQGLANPSPVPAMAARCLLQLYTLEKRLLRKALEPESLTSLCFQALQPQAADVAQLEALRLDGAADSVAVATLCAIVTGSRVKELKRWCDNLQLHWRVAAALATLDRVRPPPSPMAAPAQPATKNWL